MTKLCPAVRVQRIAYPDNPVMAYMWHGFLMFAASEKDLIKAFEDDTGLSWPFNADISPIDHAIDKATGYDVVVIDKFVDWLNENYWGEDPFHASTEEDQM
jgi:hypothetical protein